MECRGWRSAAERYEHAARRGRGATSEVRVAARELDEFLASDDWQAASWLLRVSGKPPLKIAREKVLLQNGLAEAQYYVDHRGIHCFVVFAGESRGCVPASEDVVSAWAFSWSASATGFMRWLKNEIDRARDEAPDLAGQWAWR